MSDKAEIVYRLHRLLTGERNTRDLDRIFAWLRFRLYGRAPAVRDVADFAFHLEDRNQGHSWTMLQSIAHTLAYHMPRIEVQGTNIPKPGDKESLVNVLWASFSLDRPEKMLGRVGMSKRKIKRTLTSLITKIDAFDGERVDVNRPLTLQEERVLREYSSVLISRHSFNDTQLIKQLAWAVVHNGLIGESDTGDILALKDYVTLFVIEKMHLAKATLPDESRATFLAGIRNGMLDVGALIDARWRDGTIPLLLPVFETHCRAADWIEGGLSNPERSGSWENVPLEINANWKLQAMV